MSNKNIAICRNKEKRISLGVLDSLFDIEEASRKYICARTCADGYPRS